MATLAFSAQGSIVTINGIEIGEVTEFSGPAEERPTLDATHLRSTRREFIGGLANSGEFGMTVNYLPGDPGQLELRRCQGLEAGQAMVVTLPNNPDTATPRETWSFLAVVLSSEGAGAVDEIMQREWTLQISGAITYG